MLDFSVVVPAFNRSELLQRALDSVVSQSLPPREVIVVDDGSTDNTLEMLCSNFPTGIRVISQENAGVSTARNTGISASSCEWIAFLDSDDEWYCRKLEKQAKFLSENPKLLICHSDEIWIRNGIRVNPKRRHAKSGGWIFPDCLPLCAISPSAVIINQGVCADVGGFDERLPVCEDYDMWLRVTSKYPVGFVDEPLVIKYGGHDDQLSQAYPAMDRFRITALIKLLESDSLSTDYRMQTLEVLTVKIQIYCNGARKRGRESEANELESMAQRFQHELSSLE
ncbi:MAG: glycosyltransferase [Acidiferrobacterales bacterium]|nr:glycosyltransferase [Acidiferrobacterales bacterium]